MRSNKHIFCQMSMQTCLEYEICDIIYKLELEAEILEKVVFQNTVMECYPSYVKKAILKKAVDEGLVINEKAKDGQLFLNLNDSIDVSEDASLDDKIRHIIDSDQVLAMIEDYEYRKPYRHFCYFEYEGLSVDKIKSSIAANEILVFNKSLSKPIDSFDNPVVYSFGEQIFFKFSIRLTDDEGHIIKYVIIAIFDEKNSILEIRFDRIGIAYKNTYTFYKEQIEKILKYFSERFGVKFSNIDFRAVVDYMKAEKDDVTIFAQRLNRNGSTAYLEAYEAEEITIPILGELESFIADKSELFEKNEDTRKIKQELEGFLKEIEVKSDMPMVKIRMDENGTRFGITHNYKDSEYSLFMLYGELIGEEMMSSVKEYLMQCYTELRAAVSSDTVPA